ncbi:MAG: oligoendopeptidase F [Christensenellaceae bacterium]|jgi:oligoendopeptidase F|nr:oligoendopeptidase F [Christensenellaceae bacterium]
MKRSEVAEQYKWDLSSYYKNEAEFERDFAKAQGFVEKFNKLPHALNKENALDALKLESEAGLLIGRLYVYSHLVKDENTSKTESLTRMQRMQMLYVQILQASSFIEPVLAKLSDAELTEILNDPRYENFSRQIYGLIRSKKHILSEEQEGIMSAISAFTHDFQEVFTMLDNADMKFGKIKIDGVTTDLTHGKYSLILQNPDRKLRAKAFKQYYKSFHSHINTIAATYVGNVKKNCTIAKIRGYKSALESALFNEEITDTVYKNNIESVASGFEAMHKYVAYRAKKLGLERAEFYDMYIPLIKDADIQLEYEDAVSLVKEALKPLGNEYLTALSSLFTERHVDVFETENKRSGAYQSGTYGCPPVVLLNYEKTTHDVFTIAHEAGHAMHTHFSNAAQCYEKSEYVIFIAEIASTVNEVLLLKHLLKTATGETREYLLSYYIDMFRTTIFRQTMFSEFEAFAHGSYEKGKALTAESFSKFYLSLNKKYYGKSAVHGKDIAAEWARIPHFYNAFYVYKYSTGLTSAVNIANKILADPAYVEKYLKFLSLGGSLPTLDILRTADVDLETKDPFEFAMREFSAAMDELFK